MMTDLNSPSDGLLSRSLALRPAVGGLVTELDPRWSNAPRAADPERGGPLGGLMAALAALAARRALALKAPLQTLTVEFLAAARFAPATFLARAARGGRAMAYTTIEARQDSRQVLQAMAFFGAQGGGPALPLLPQAPASLSQSEPAAGAGDLFPWFHRQIEYRFCGGTRLFGLNAGGEPVLRLWAQTDDRAPLDESRVCMLLDGVYPTFWTATPDPVFAATVDLRYDFLEPVTRETSPEGWLYMEHRTRHLGGGWAVEDAIGFAPDGRPLAMARQRRKLARP